MSTSLKSYLTALLLLFPSSPLGYLFSLSTAYRWNLWLLPPSAPPVRDRTTGEQGESDGRGVRNHLDASLNSTTRWICRSPAFHNCRWSKMDVGRIPLDRKSKKCQRSHSEWIVLNLSGNVIFSSLRPKIFFLLLEECAGMTEISAYLAEAYFNITCSTELVLGHQEDWWDIQLLIIQGQIFGCPRRTDPLSHPSNSAPHTSANTAWSQEHAKTFSINRNTGHHPRLSDLASPKMWHLPPFLLYTCCIHNSASGPLPPGIASSLSLLPVSPSHILIPLHTSINRALQSAENHTVLNAAVVQLQWAATDLYHWIKCGWGEKPCVLKPGTSPTLLSFTPHFPWTDA